MLYPLEIKKNYSTEEGICRPEGGKSPLYPPANCTLCDLEREREKERGSEDM